MSKVAQRLPLLQRQRIELVPLNRIKTNYLVIIIWVTYFMGAAVSLLWIANQSRQLLASYQQSPQCGTGEFTVIPQNCRMMIDVRVDNKWITDTAGGGAKGGGYPEKVNFIVTLPNGDPRTLSAQINNHGATDNGAFNWYYLSRFLEMEQGKVVQAEFWEGRVTSVTAPLPVLLGDPLSEIQQQTFRTDDHPLNDLSNNLSKTLSILGILFLPLILGTAFLILKK